MVRQNLNIPLNINVIFRKDAGGGSIQSTLVETVSINYEDFNESFLTCSTCLCECKL